MASIDLNLQPLGGDHLAALVVSPALQASANLPQPVALLDQLAAWRRRFLMHHGGGGTTLPASVVDDYSQQLIDGLRHWLQEKEWEGLQRALRLQPGLPLRLRVADSLRELEALPWETLPLDRPLWRLPPSDPLLPEAAPRNRRARLLLLVGEEEGLGLEEEVRALIGLAERARWEMRILRGREAAPAALRQALEAEPGWDVLIHLGHASEDPQQGGRLQLGDGSWVSGASLEGPLRRAADHGLRLILLNSCSGMDLAHRFLAVGVAWVQVFRDAVPSGAAALVFARLLRLLENGRPFPQAVMAAGQALEHPPWAGCRGLLSVYGHPEASAYQWPRLNPRLQRRELLRLGAVAAASGGLAGGLAWDQRGRQGSTEWTMASWLEGENRNLLLAQVPHFLAGRLAEISGGRFRLNVENAFRTDSSTILGRVNSGEVNCGYADVYYDPKLKPLWFFKAIPFGLTPREQEAWLWHVRDGETLTYAPQETRPLACSYPGCLESREDQERHRKLPFRQTIYRLIADDKGSKLANLMSIPISCTGGQMGGWFKREIRTAEDLRGLRMRIPGLGAEVLEKFGVETNNSGDGSIIPPSRIRQSLGRSTLDAAEWIGPRDDMVLGLHELGCLYYGDGWWEPSTTTDLFLNRRAFLALSRENQAALYAACASTYQWVQREYDIQNMHALERLRRQGVALRRFPPPLMAAFRARTEEVLAHYSRVDPAVFGQVHTEWRSFRDRFRGALAITQFDPGEPLPPSDPGPP